MLPRARKIEVDGTLYHYMLSKSKGALVGNSGPTIRVTVQLPVPVGNQRVVQFAFISKKWLEMSDYDREHGTHKAPFTPKDVAAAIREATQKGWTLTASFNLPEWEFLPSKKT